MKQITAALALVLVLASCASIRAKKPFTVDIYSPRYAAGSAELQTDKPLGGVKKNDVNIYYYPEDDAVCLEFRAGTVIYRQFWSRDAFAAALERYKADYEQRSLITKSSKTKRAYGKVQGYIAWSTLSVLTEQASGVAALELGYTFKDRMPFFSLMQRSAENENKASKIKASSNVVLYFTRAQAEAITIVFNQEYLNGLERSGGKQQEGLREKLRDIFNVR